jgi:hypothetical protein
VHKRHIIHALCKYFFHEKLTFCLYDYSFFRTSCAEKRKMASNNKSLYHVPIPSVVQYLISVLLKAAAQLPCIFYIGGRFVFLNISFHRFILATGMSFLYNRK